jgi:phosphatidylinositol alpha-1,6-mannosyltransferase
MASSKKVWLIHSGAGVGQGGIERVNQEILDGWRTASKLKLVPFQPKKNIQSIARYMRGCRERDNQATIFMHLGLTKFLLFGRPPGSLNVFLHGIEAWKKLPRWHKYLIRSVDHFVTNSKFTWDRFLQFNPEFSHVRHDVVHLGLGEPIELMEPDPDIPAALIIGRMSKTEDYKGHRELISIWPQVRQRVPAAELWVVGAGDLKPELERLSKDQVGIRFYGKVSEDEKQDLLRRCRVFVMPSRNEGFGLVYLEAMRLGRPCLVGDTDAGREVINSPEAGFEVNSSNQSELLRSLLVLLEKKSIWDSISENAFNRWKSMYTSKLFVNRFVSLFSMSFNKE